MLKIKKTKPYQHSSVHIIICAIALICGIVPSLALLTYYNPYTESTYAARKTLSNITTMQEMTTDICNNSALGQSNTLIDIRDNSTYTVARLSDGNCWMTQNLRIIDKEITPEDSDVIENFTIPPSALWASTNIDESHAYYDNDTDYGAYYNWYTATVGTGTSELTEGNAESSICPKGWHLPTSEEFQNLYDKFPDATWATINDRSGRWFGASSVSAGGALLLADGYMRTADGLSANINLYGYYWTNASKDKTQAYSLRFNRKELTIDGNSRKSNGYSIRCLTPASSTNFPELFDEKDSTVSVTVPKVLTIDAVSKALTLEADPNQIIEGNISATVSANTTYSIQLSAENPDLTNPNDPDHTIPASTTVQKGTNAWGILNQDNSTYSAITTNPITYYNTEEYNEEAQSTKHTFGIGVSISPALPAGEYSTTVTITAVNN